jgi:hypothetical protein
MVGTGCVRLCTVCGQNVYNLSAMSRAEAEALIRQKEGRPCVRFYQRSDGMVLTKNCPIGANTIQRRIRAFITFAASFLVMAFGLSAHSASRKSDSWITQMEPIRTFLEWIDPGGGLSGASPSKRDCVMGKM